MTSQTEITEEDLEDALRSKDIDFFMELLMDEFGNALKRRIKFHSCGFLKLDEMREVYQKAMIEVHKKVREPEFSYQRPLAFVKHLVKLRTLDARRSKGRQKLSTNTDELLAAMAQATGASGMVSNWRRLSEEEQLRFMSELRTVIAESTKLSEGQRVVAQAYFDNFVHVAEEGWAVLILPIAEATGSRPKVSTIRSQWRNARLAICDELVSRGFDFLGGA